MAGHKNRAANRAAYEKRCRELGGRRPASGIPAGGSKGPGLGGKFPGHRPPVGWDWLTHGASSPRVVSQVADQLRAELLEVRPDLAAPEFAPALAAWATAEARCQLLRNYSDDHGLLDSDGDPLSYVKLSEQMEGRAARARATLGLDPRSSAALARERADATTTLVGLAQLADAGRAALDSRSTPQLAGPLEGDRPAGVARLDQHLDAPLDEDQSAGRPGPLDGDHDEEAGR